MPVLLANNAATEHIISEREPKHNLKTILSPPEYGNQTLTYHLVANCVHISNTENISNEIRDAVTTVDSDNYYYC